MGPEAAIRAAAARNGRRPGLLVVAALEGSESAIESVGPLPRDCPPERAVFEIGSITKVFTSLLLAIAVERGEARIDDPLAAHLPAGTRVPRVGEREITLLHLVTHRSGLPKLPPGLLWYALRHRDDPYARLTSERVLDALARTKPRRAPGERFRYSNFRAGLLGLALAHAAGSDYETLVRERIAGPLGMADTVIVLDEDRRARLAVGTSRRGKPAGLWSLPGLAGAGALRSTATDLLTFAAAQLGELPPGASPALAAAIAATHEPRAAAGRLTPRCGSAWGG